LEANDELVDDDAVDGQTGEGGQTQRRPEASARRQQVDGAPALAAQAPTGAAAGHQLVRRGGVDTDAGVEAQAHQVQRQREIAAAAAGVAVAVAVSVGNVEIGGVELGVLVGVFVGVFLGDEIGVFVAL